VLITKKQQAKGEAETLSAHEHASSFMFKCVREGWIFWECKRSPSPLNETSHKKWVKIIWKLNKTTQQTWAFKSQHTHAHVKNKKKHAEFTTLKKSMFIISNKSACYCY